METIKTEHLVSGLNVNLGYLSITHSENGKDQILSGCGTRISMNGKEWPIRRLELVIDVEDAIRVKVEYFVEGK